MDKIIPVTWPDEITEQVRKAFSKVGLTPPDDTRIIEEGVSLWLQAMQSASQGASLARVDKDGKTTDLSIEGLDDLKKRAGSFTGVSPVVHIREIFQGAYRSTNYDPLRRSGETYKAKGALSVVGGKDAPEQDDPAPPPGSGSRPSFSSRHS